MHGRTCRATVWRMPRRALHPAKDKALTRLAEVGVKDDGHVRHRLRRWMIAHGITLTEMSILCCVGRPQLSHLLNGSHHNATYMTLAGAFSIEWVTKGEVQAWEWLDDPYQAARVRKMRMAAAKGIEDSYKQLILRGRGGGTVDGMLRRKARTLSRLFQVNWTEVRRRAWADARQTAEWESADVSHLMIAKDGD